MATDPMDPSASAEVETARRHRILIAAAVAAVVGEGRIRQIRPAAWTRRRAQRIKAAPDFRHRVEPPDAAPEQHPEDAEVECDS